MPDTDAVLYPRLYRAIKKKSWYQGTPKRIVSAAFMLRTGEPGLSLIKSPARCAPINTRENCGSNQNECYGEFVLETERIRELGLGVEEEEPDSPEFLENHVEITGLPPLEDKLRAEDLASDLVEISQFHWDRFGKFT